MVKVLDHIQKVDIMFGGSSSDRFMRGIEWRGIIPHLT